MGKIAEDKKVNIPLSEDAHTKAKLISTIKKTKLKDYLQKIVEDGIKKDEEVLRRMR
ncbi:MAG TPA: hypothetical protein HA282_05000 [Nanoarchaeota archaeon]|nr:hypothetical protein [Candidatus Pacearchaeota archaeon]HIH18178.1 hypothetical protein [Nanoarchaeota archaeon]HIH34585.1 hypothetical protein [Nanoarchaeota archaeon]HIH51841.1 hypothetical protein [Nanoarchaeota archaeon]HIH66539.1 hypothetical protein [Nanoarchaeota archaeon]